MSLPSIKFRQARCNWFTNKFLPGIAPLLVDGVEGEHTKNRYALVRWYLGEGKGRKRAWTVELAHRIVHMNNRRYSAYQRRVGAYRRVQHRIRWRKMQFKAVFVKGVTRYDGMPVAKWMVPYLNWARANGWRGRLNSGWRDPAYSRQLCYSMCGAPQCAGRCAGTASNHVGDERPKGAVDVSDSANFGQLMLKCPLEPTLINRLGARDVVHFSASGY